MKRREFIRTALATGAAAWLPVGASEDSAFQLVDSNVSLFDWPFRKLPLDETSVLMEKLRSLGVGQAFAGSYEGLFHRDLPAVNHRLAKESTGVPELLPIGSVNPDLPAWREVLRSCAEDHEMRGIRLHPNYHGYTLDDPRFRELLERAAEIGLFVQLAATMEDRRTQNSIAAVPDVDLTPLPTVVAAVPGVRVQVLNWRPRMAELESMKDVSGIHFDTARVDGTDGIEQLQKVVSPDRVLFGSGAHFLIPEASLIRLMHESGLEEEILEKIAQTNSVRLRGGNPA
ncbi:MAG: amidohydrolase family protein [Verrucomicrobiales bacterium]|nr:amidohydrolase family protein [Verrucomicrobiales bacterium]